MARDLKMFMRGKSVTMLQNMLKQMGYPMNDVQGVFGASTRDGVKDFQKRKGLKGTGIVDDELMELMRQSVGFQADKKQKRENPAQPSATVNADRLEALVALLVSKGVITEEELAETVPAKPAKASGSPLF